MVVRGWVSVRRPRRVAAAVAVVIVTLAAGLVVAASPAPASGTTALYAWGSNWSRQVGTGSRSEWEPSPVLLARFGGAVVQAVGSGRVSMVLLTDGTVWAWGNNDEGELGNGTTAASPVPVRVGSLDHVVSIAAGTMHGVAVQDTGVVWAWGDNGRGQLGNGTTTGGRLVPVRVATLSGVAKVAAGAFHTLALKTNGEVWAWGDNTFGEIGNGSTDTVVATPVRAATPYGIGQVAASGSQSMALRTASLGGSVWTWGANVAGEVGDNTTITRYTPVLVFRNASAIGLGEETSFAVGSDGFMYSWGWNRCGALGDGTLVDHLVPHNTGLSGVVSVAGGEADGIAIRSDGSVWTWGYTFNVRCDNPALGFPAQVPGLTSARSASLSPFGAFLVIADAPPPSTVAVPGLIDDTCDQAILELRSIGLDGSCHGTGQYVGGQSPGEGAVVPLGTVVSLTMAVNPP